MSFYDKVENCVKKLFTTNSAETNQHDQKTSDDPKKHFTGHVEDEKHSNFSNLVTTRETDESTLLTQETLVITEALEEKLKHSASFIALFYWKLDQNCTKHQKHLVKQRCVDNPTEKSWAWSDTSYVRLPLSKYHALGHTPKWEVINKSLTELKSNCLESNTEHMKRIEVDVMMWFGASICKYNHKAMDTCNFRVLKGDKNFATFLIRVTPVIIDNALLLPARLQGPIPILKRGVPRTVCFSRKLICSVLANAFMCTFPEQTGRNLSYINFDRLFHAGDKPIKTNIKREKIKCILSYFEKLCEESGPSDSVLTFERRCINKKFYWEFSGMKLCPVEVLLRERIEDAAGSLQVDFANKVVGGGVLNEGAVQEEIRFCISPELILARLFTEPLTDYEVLVITGSAQYSTYSGYGSSFEFRDLVQNVQAYDTDNLGREFTQVVAMDALNFAPSEVLGQYDADKINRELHKCYVGFVQGKHVTSVATGCWGCGCFNGDPELKFLIQWMAVSVNNRKGMLFYATDENQKNEFTHMGMLLQKTEITISILYQILLSYKANCIKRSFGSQQCYKVKTVFEYVLSRLHYNN